MQQYFLSAESSTSKQRTVREENESSRIAAAEGTEPPAVKKDVTEPGDSRPGKASAKRVLFPEEAQQDEKKPTKVLRLCNSFFVPVLDSAEVTVQSNPGRTGHECVSGAQ